MSTIKVSTIAPLGTDATKTITIGDITNGDVAAGAFSSTPSFRATNSSIQTISLATATKVTLDTVSYDTDSGFSSSKYTVPTGKGGKYYISLQCSFESSSDYDEVWLRVYKNGSHHVGLEARNKTAGNNFNAGSSQRMNTSGVMDLSAGDYLEMYGILGGAGTPQFNSGQAVFSGFRIVGV